MVGNIKEIPQDDLPNIRDGKTHLFFVDDGANNRDSFKMSCLVRLRDVADKVQVTIFDMSHELRDFLLAQDDLNNVVVATDKDMPESISGIKLAMALKERDPNLPIVIWTGNPDEALEDANLPAGVRVFDKPKISEMFAEFIRPQLLAKLESPARPATAERGLPSDKPEPGK